jgi:hypothetical protein
MLPDEQPSSEQIKIWKSMSTEQRVEIARSIYESVWKMKTAGVRWLKPDLSSEQVNAEVANIFSRVDAEYFFEGILPMLTVCGERFERKIFTEWLEAWNLDEVP